MEFLKQVQYVDSLLMKAKKHDLVNDLNGSIERVTAVVTKAAKFAESLHGKGFWGRVFGAGKHEMQLNDLSDELTRAVQMMQVDFNLSTPPVLDFVAAAQRDGEKESALRKRLKEIEAAASDPSVVERLIDSAMEKQSTDGAHVDGRQIQD
eukprot:COSAG06_NODE_31004_length_528_cov_1.226107_1_plen_150_part_10